MVSHRLAGATNRARLAGIVSCLVVGLVVATGRGLVAVLLLGVTLLTGAIVFERRRMARLLWAGVAFTAPLQGVRIAPTLAVSDLLIMAALVAVLPAFLLHRGRRVLPPGMIVAFGFVVASGLIGTLFAPDAGASLANVVKMTLAVLGSVMAMVMWHPTVADLRRFAWLWFAGAATSAVWAAVTPRSFSGRAVGLTSHPNHFGLVCALGVGLGLGLAFGSTGRARVAAFAGVAILTAGIGLSGSRAAVVGLTVTIAVTALLTRRFRLLVATGVIVVLATMAAIVGIVHLPESNAISRLAGGGGSAASDLQRSQTLDEALESIARHPFTGSGFEFAQAAHNIYLQVLVVGGPLALLSFLFAAGQILRTGGRSARRAHDHVAGPVVAGLTAGYAGYLCSGFFDNTLWDRYLWTYIGLLLILAASVRHRDGADPRDPAAAPVIRSGIEPVTPPADGQPHRLRRGAEEMTLGVGAGQQPAPGCA